MCVCVHVCMHACVCVRESVCVHARLRACTCLHKNMCVCVCSVVHPKIKTRIINYKTTHSLLLLLFALVHLVSVSVSAKDGIIALG